MSSLLLRFVPFVVTVIALIALLFPAGIVANEVIQVDGYTYAQVDGKFSVLVGTYAPGDTDAAPPEYAPIIDAGTLVNALTSDHFNSSEYNSGAFVNFDSLVQSISGKEGIELVKSYAFINALYLKVDRNVLERLFILKNANVGIRNVEPDQTISIY